MITFDDLKTDSCRNKQGLPKGDFVKHIPCDHCGSRDANSLYSSNTSYCYTCQTYKNLTDNTIETKGGPLIKNNITPIGDLRFVELTKRGINQDTAELYSYGLTQTDKGIAQAATYYHKNKPVAQKLRYKDKNFGWVGSPKDCGLFGMNLWSPSKHKNLVIVEGEIDALSVSQAYHNKFAVVSLPNGAQSAVNDIKNNLEYISQFEKVTLWFDNDEPGIEATEKVADVLMNSEIYIVQPYKDYKDANDLLISEGNNSIQERVKEASKFMADGIINAQDITFDEFDEEEAMDTYSVPYAGLDKMHKGLHKGEICTITSGTGMGKTTFSISLVYHMMKEHNLKVFHMGLEETKKESLAKYLSIPTNIPVLDILDKDNDVDRKMLRTEYDKMVSNGNLIVYDHASDKSPEAILKKIYYAATTLGVDFVLLDHLSMIVSSQRSSSEGERRDIDVIMTKLRDICVQTGVGIVLINHLRNPEGKSHEEGGRVTANQLRGSGAIKQISNSIIGLERDQQGENPNEVTVRVLKSRLAGSTGVAQTLIYDHATGSLKDNNVPGYVVPKKQPVKKVDKVKPKVITPDVELEDEILKELG